MIDWTFLISNWTFLILGILFSCVIFFYYVFKPIEKNRYLYGKQPVKMIGSIVFAIITGFLLFTGICGFLPPSSKEIVNWSEDALSKNEPNKKNDYELKIDSIQTLITPTTSDELRNKYNEEIRHIQQLDSLQKSKTEVLEKGWAILSQFTDPGNLPSAHGYGRGIALISALLGIIGLSGFLLSSFVNFISRRSEKWKKGLIHYRPHRFYKWRWGLHRFVVIIGVNDQTVAIAKQALKRTDIDYVLIQTRQDVEKMRMRLDLGLDNKEENRIILYYAERTSVEDISLLHLEYAAEVYILGEDITYENEEDHDAYNIECLRLLSKYMEKEDVRSIKAQNGTRLKCNVAFEYQSTFTAFKATHIYKTLDRYIEFVPFNVHELWAKKVLVDNFAIIPGREVGEVAVQRYKPLDGDGIKIDDQKTVHLVIMGMNQMGTAFAVQAALLAHYPNFAQDNRLKTTITFIDDQAIKEGEFFRGRFASLFNISTHRTINCEELKDENIDPVFEESEELKKRISHLVKDGEDLMDVKWEFIQGNVASEKIINYLTKITEDKNKITTIAICFNHPQTSIATAMYLPSPVLRNAYQILVYQQNSFDVLNTVATGDLDWKRYKNMVPFGMIESSYNGDSYDSVLAKLEHYTYIGKKEPRENATKQGKKKEEYKYELYASFHNNPTPSYALIQEIEQKWEELGIVQKLANIDMVESIPTKLRSMGINYTGNVRKVEDFFNGTEINPITPELKRLRFEKFGQSEHMRWMTERLLMGFRPLRVDEQNDIITEKSSEIRFRKKESNKLAHRAHLDICSNARLESVDEDMKYNDLDVIAFLPLVLRYSEWMTVMKHLHHDDGNINNNVLDEILGNYDDLRFKFVKKGMLPQKAKNDDSIKEDLNKEKAIIENHNFWIADTPTTQSLWKKIMGQKKTDWSSSKHPVVNISKEEIEDFLLVLRKKTGLYFSLPSQREWKYAAMLSTDYLDKFDFKQYEKDRKIDKLEKELQKYLCISSTKPNFDRENREKQLSNTLSGVYDMLGNVWEWTRTTAKNDKHGECYYFCGGSWHFKYKECDLYSEIPYWYSYWLPKLKSTDVGFRLIWKFDDEKLSGIIEEECKRISTSKEQKRNKDEQKLEAIEKWFKKYPMVSIEEGMFMMGTENEEKVLDGENNMVYPFPDENAGEEETPHHYVKISKFEICSVPVTQKLWNIVMEVAPKENPSSTIGDEYPQTNVSYRDIVDKFLHELNRLTRKEYRLPTEAEWEYVAKGGHTAKFNETLAKAAQQIDPSKERSESASLELDKALCGLDSNPYPKYSGSDTASEVAWFKQNSPQKVKSRSKKPCLSVGDKHVYDMSGNIWEWILDYYQSDMYNDCVKCEEENRHNIQPKQNRNEPSYNRQGYITNPVCLNKAYSAHVFRGGSWCFDEISSRCTSVNFWIDTDKDEDLGFRLVIGSAVSLDDFKTKEKGKFILYWNKIKRTFVGN